MKGYVALLGDRMFAGEPAGRVLARVLQQLQPMTDSSSPVSSSVERRVRFLLVDDEPALLRAMRRVIAQRRPNWELCLATSAEAALRLLAEQAFDCVMSDLRMPEVDGLRLLELVGRRHPRCARVAHSSHIETIGRDKVGGVCDFMLQKPAPAEVVIETLERAAELSRDRSPGQTEAG